MAVRKRLGEIFVEQGIITVTTVERVLARAKVLNRRFGTMLEELELVSGQELAHALAIQYGCKVVPNLLKLAIAPTLLELIPVGVAMEHFLFPLKQEHGMLAMAMADPTDTRMVENIAANHGLKIVPFIATKKDIHAAICRHYLGKLPATSDERTVMVADSDKTVLNQFGSMLKRKGYRVVVAADGMEGYKTVITERPQVIITARELPKLDGYGLLSALQNIPETRFVPVILVTGRSMSAEEEAKAFDKGFFDFIVKPVSEVTLQARIKRALHFYDRQYRLA